MVLVQKIGQVKLSEQVSTGLDGYRKRRDEAAEAVFKWLYG